MLAARIPCGKKLLKKRTSPSFSIQVEPTTGKILLNISIVLDDSIITLVDDQPEVKDPVVTKNFRDARVGLELLQPNNLTELKISSRAGSDGTADFTLVGKLDTKIPGTGEDLRTLLQ